MADDPKVSQAVYRDYARGLGVEDIAARHNVKPGQVSRIVQFEGAVQARVREALDKQQRLQQRRAERAAKAAQQGKAPPRPGGRQPAKRGK